MKLWHLTSQYLSKLLDIEVDLRELADTIDYRGCPRDRQWSKSISLIQVSIHILLHCFPRKFVLHAFHVILWLLLVHVKDKVLQLAKSQRFVHLCRSCSNSGADLQQRLSSCQLVMLGLVVAGRQLGWLWRDVSVLIYFKGWSFGSLHWLSVPVMCVWPIS